MTRLLAGAAAYLYTAQCAVSWSTALYGEPMTAPAPASVMIAGLRIAEPAQGFPRRLQPRREGGASQRIVRTGDSYSVQYGFRNFNQDDLTVEVSMPAREVEASVAEFGFSPAALKALDAWYQQAQKSAIDQAQRRMYVGKVTAPTQAELEGRLAEIRRVNAAIQARLDEQLGALASEYRRRRLKVYADAGFKVQGKHTLTADVPGLVRRNAGRMNPAASAFAGLAEEREYGLEDLVGAVAAMAQTALRYELPGAWAGEKVVGGILPPPKSFVMGQGDCDTKTALMGSILVNWPNLKLVGLAIPDHYLLAVHRIPARGEVYVEFEGLPYVMIEPAGPAWLPPGKVGRFTEEYLELDKLFAIQEFAS